VLESLEWEEERDDGELFILWDDRSVRFVRAIAPEGEVTTRVYFAEVRIPVFFFDEDQLPWIRHYLSSLVPDPSLRWQNGSSCLVASSPVSQSSPYSRRESGGRSSRDHKCLINWMMKFVQWLRSP